MTSAALNIIPCLLTGEPRERRRLLLGEIGPFPKLRHFVSVEQCPRAARRTSPRLFCGGPFSQVRRMT